MTAAAKTPAQPALELEPQPEPVAFDDFCKVRYDGAVKV